METITDGVFYLLSFWMTGWPALPLYWLPLSLCVFGYTLRTTENYQKDLIEREKFLNYEMKRKELEGDVDALDQLYRSVRIENEKYTTYYKPTDRIGTLIGRALVSIIPIANLWAGMFDISPRLFSRLIERIEIIFDTPLVPSNKDI